MGSNSPNRVVAQCGYFTHFLTFFHSFTLLIPSFSLSLIQTLTHNSHVLPQITFHHLRLSLKLLQSSQKHFSHHLLQFSYYVLFTFLHSISHNYLFPPSFHHRPLKWVRNKPWIFTFWLPPWIWGGVLANIALGLHHHHRPSRGMIPSWMSSSNLKNTTRKFSAPKKAQGNSYPFSSYWISK